jgi:exodeoxyribonuclease III
MSFNANGIRSAAKKGFFDWFMSQEVDVLCLQETKAQVHQLTEDIFYPAGYHCYYKDAVKKGYSGVALFSRQKPDKVITEIGLSRADEEGRYIQADFGSLSIVSLYLPSGSSGEEKQAFKFRFLDFYLPVLQGQLLDNRQWIIAGDLNIAHKPIDLKNWKSNQKNSGFLPEERAWLDTVFNQFNYVDAFREINPSAEEYTWWSARGQARAKNVGWRIDYQVVSPLLRDKIQSVSIYRDQPFSDHAPVIVDYLFDAK